MEVMDYNLMILAMICKYLLCLIALHRESLFLHSLLVFLIHPSALGGGGGGSGGSVRFSACTLTAGSSAKIEAKGGSGGQAKNYGTRILCVMLYFISKLDLILINHNTGYGGGGGGAGAFLYEAVTIDIDDMTINVNGGNRGEGDSSISGRRGFAGSVGKVFLVSSLSFVSYLIVMCLK